MIFMTCTTFILVLKNFQLFWLLLAWVFGDNVTLNSLIFLFPMKKASAIFKYYFIIGPLVLFNI